MEERFTCEDFLPSLILAYGIKVNPEVASELEGQVETLRDETRGLRIDYVNIRDDLAQLRNAHVRLRNSQVQLSNAHIQLRSDFQHLSNERAAEKEKVVDWETRSRISRGLNDQWVPLVQADYNLLRNNGIKSLPHILSVWAIKSHQDPAPRFLDKLPEKEVKRLRERAVLFQSKGLCEVINRIWDSVTTTDRIVMIAMYLGTRSYPSPSIAHPPPTEDEARRVIEHDSVLSTEEKDAACGIIEIALDEKGYPLFSDF